MVTLETGPKAEFELDDTSDVTATLRALRGYGTHDQHGIRGLSQAGPIAAMWSLLDHQAQAGYRGDVLEIGLFEGQTFFLLCAGLLPNDTAIGVDLFIAEERKRDFVQNLHRLEIDPAVVRICVGSSAAFAEEPDTAALAKKIRFLHIDGCHDYEDVLGDLQLAERIVAPTGVVAYDDFFNPLFPSVTEALADHLRLGSDLVPFALATAMESALSGSHKMFLCRPAAVTEYTNALRRFLGSHLFRRQPWMGNEIDVYTFEGELKKFDPLRPDEQSRP